MDAHPRLRAATATTIAPVLVGSVLLGSTLIGGAGIVALTAAPASAASACAPLSAKVHRMTAPKNAYVVLSRDSAEITRLKKAKFTDDGVLFGAAAKTGGGLVAVRSLVNSKTQDRIFTTRTQDVTNWRRAGYVQSGTPFFTAAKAGDSCLTAVHRYVKNGKHRFAVASAYANSLVKSGWHREGVAFSAAKPNVSTTPSTGDAIFSFAVMPDTQQEVLSTSDKRFENRTAWLAKNKSALDLRFVTHTGDVVNWDTADHSQYVIASNAMSKLESAKIPYTMAIGNHDSQATGAGGSARDPANTKKLQRDTSVFNRYFTKARYGGAVTVFERDKVDNAYALYEGGGVKWMVMVLELWPRPSAVQWAKQAVASHPDYNVIVSTHSFLTASGGIEQRADYGDTTPQQLFDQFIKQYPNIKMVFAGHVGQANHKVLKGARGNKIYAYLQTFHSNSENPVRMVTVDTSRGTVKTWIYAPSSNRTQSQYSSTETGVSFVR